MRSFWLVSSLQVYVTLVDTDFNSLNTTQALHYTVTHFIFSVSLGEFNQQFFRGDL